MPRMADVDGLFGLLMTDAAGPSASDLALIEEMQAAEDAFERRMDRAAEEAAFGRQTDGDLGDILELWARVRRARAAAGY